MIAPAERKAFSVTETEIDPNSEIAMASARGPPRAGGGGPPKPSRLGANFFLRTKKLVERSFRRAAENCTPAACAPRAAALRAIPTSEFGVNPRGGIFRGTKKRAAPKTRGADSPLDQCRAPGEAGSEDDEENEVASLDLAGGDGFVEGDGDGRGGGVAVFVEVHKNLAGLRAEAVTDGVDDALVGLVRDDALDLGDVDFATAHHLVGRAAHGVDGVLESFFSLHPQEVQAVRHRRDGRGGNGCRRRASRGDRPCRRPRPCRR